MRKVELKLAVALLSFAGVVATAADLAAPFSLENSQVLPSGVRNPRFISLGTTLTNRFGGEGDKLQLGDRLNKPVQWQDVLDSQDDQTQKNLIRSILNDKGINFDSAAGRASGIVNAQVNVQVPALAWGVNEKVTVAVAVPIVRAQIATDTGFSRSTNGQTFIDEVCRISPDKCNESAGQLNNAINHKLTRLGYQSIHDETISGIGDIQLQGKYQFFHSTESGLAGRLSLSLPTGTKPNPDKALDITTGDNRFKLGAHAVYEHRLVSALSGNVYGGYTALLPNTQTKRLPTSEWDSLSRDKVELTRKWGHLVSFGTGLAYAIESAGVVVNAGYNFQSLSRTQYSGGTPDQQTRVGLIGNLEPDQILHSFVTTVGFSTVDWYLKKKFALPFQLNAAYSHPFAGRHAPTNDVIAGEVVLFF